MLTGYQIQIIAELGDLIVKLGRGRIGGLQVQELGRHKQAGRDKSFKEGIVLALIDWVKVSPTSNGAT